MKSSLHDGILHLVLDSPKTRNAFGPTEAKILAKSLTAKNIQLIVLSSEGRVFCSGGPLHEYAALKTKQQGVKLNESIRKVLKKFAEHPAPKIAAVAGDCFGGGIELMSCCDWIIAESQVFFGLWQRRMELSFGWGGYGRLKERLAPAALKNWLYSGDVKSAFAAHRLGLVDEVVGPGEISSRIQAMVINQSHLHLESFKEIQKGLEKNETLLFNKLWWSDNHRKILKAFKAK